MTHYFQASFNVVPLGAQPTELNEQYKTLTGLDPLELKREPSVFWLRITDNVLDDDSYPMVRCRMIRDKHDVPRITSITVICFGDYSDFPTIGDTWVDIINWVGYDPTGNHPEVYHELWVDLGREKRSRNIK